MHETSHRKRREHQLLYSHLVISCCDVEKQRNGYNLPIVTRSCLTIYKQKTAVKINFKNLSLLVICIVKYILGTILDFNVDLITLVIALTEISCRC